MRIPAAIMHAADRAGWPQSRRIVRRWVKASKDPGGFAGYARPFDLEANKAYMAALKALFEPMLEVQLYRDRPFMGSARRT